MGVVRVDALCECDACQKRFGVELDLADEPADYDSLVREKVMNGNGIYYTWAVRAKATVDRISLSYQPTIQGGLLLCDVCSKKCDAVPIEGNLTYRQVMHALGLPMQEGDL